jgi:hypothetical protein
MEVGLRYFCVATYQVLGKWPEVLRYKFDKYLIEGDKWKLENWDIFQKVSVKRVSIWEQRPEVI